LHESIINQDQKLISPGNILEILGNIGTHHAGGIDVPAIRMIFHIHLKIADISFGGFEIGYLQHGEFYFGGVDLGIMVQKQAHGRFEVIFKFAPGYFFMTGK
jgi:hypothetical protein